jgi:hypothetical protein
VPAERDPSTQDRDVGVYPWVAGTIQHTPAEEKHVRDLRGRGQRQDSEEQER